VTGLYPVSVVVDPSLPVRPDSLYGMSKAAGEALGRLYAEKFGLEFRIVDELPLTVTGKMSRRS
jgi:nucleoside-diphosphate-sugar epimerase